MSGVTVRVTVSPWYADILSALTLPPEKAPMLIAYRVGGVGAALTVMLNGTGAEAPTLFVAVTLKVAVPVAVGVPVMTPLLLSVRPAGNEPVDTAQLVGLFVAVSVWLYGVPVVPSVREVVLMTGTLGAAVNVCVTTRLVTELAGIAKVKAKRLPVVTFSPAVTVLVTVPEAVIPAPSVALVKPTVCVPAVVAVPDSVIVTVMGVVAACGLTGLITPVAVRPF